MPTALVNARIVTGDAVLDGHAVVIGQGRIEAVAAVGRLPAGMERVDLEGLTLAPGFIDTQVNGGGGVLFNDAPTAEGIEAIGRAHRRFGATGFLPTLISDDFAVIRRAVAAVDAAMAAGAPGLLGIHIEGPFLNPLRKGIHDDAKLRTLDAEGFEILTSLKRGRTLVTLAPETVAPACISELAEAGVIVAAGHTNAGYETMRRALASGLTGVTHLFNAMSPLTSRKPGVVGAVLEDRAAWAGLIVDGEHVDPATLRVALRCRPLDRFMLVTDAMPCVGDDKLNFDLQGRTIFVRDGACYDENGVLAGSNLDMARAVGNAQTMLGLTLPQACVMASGAPAAFLGLEDRGSIAPGKRADLVALDEDGAVWATWIGGEMQRSARIEKTTVEAPLHAVSNAEP